AAYWAAQGRFSFGGVVLAGTVGSYLGAAATYWVARWLGRPLLVRYGRYIFCPEQKRLRAERWLGRHGAGGTLFTRLLPVVRPFQIRVSVTVARTLAFYKPYGVLSCFTDPEGRPTLAGFMTIPDVYPAGRLDFDTEGLLLLTSDGVLAHHITDPRHKLSKVYL